MDALLTKQQAAEALAVSTATLDRWHREGKGPCRLKVGRGVRYRARDLDAWMNDFVKEKGD